MESGIEAGPIPTITGSLGSGTRGSLGTISRVGLDNEPMYDTDNTDLGSDVDEAELRRELLNDKWRILFDKYDPEGFGEIPWPDFLKALKTPELQAHIPSNKRDVLLERARQSKADAITFQDFVNTMSGKRSRSFKCAVHHRDREVCSENDFHLLQRDPPLFARMVHIIAMEVLPEERDRKYYADNYTCCPPPLFIIFITLIELGFFAYYTVTNGHAALAGPVPIDSIFIYRPDKKAEIWRFFTYMFLHAGWLHLGFNLSVQTAVGLPLEMVHGGTRAAAVYLAGVAAGSLGTSVCDPTVCLAGASGGVYALLAAHLSNVLLNYHTMQWGAVRLLAVFVFASCDVGFAIYSRYAAEGCAGPPVSYVAHLTGALAGLTIGLLVLKNFEQRLHERLLWWAALGVYAACTLFAILFNLMNADGVPTPVMQPPDEALREPQALQEYGFYNGEGLS
ncbi:rhomboid-related protein 3-like [Arctopsyche grandis]|uniref:rhomboid-related protein 3-like n=1 Tax=Arctopsyche grandis TaxID=121162 RepID=UPI00406D8616